MKIYLITYDIHAPGKNYNELYETLETIGKNFKLHESVRLIAKDDTNEGAIHGTLTNVMDSNDSVLVVEFPYGSSWNNVPGLKEWLKTVR